MLYLQVVKNGFCYHSLSVKDHSQRLPPLLATSNAAALQGTIRHQPSTCQCNPDTVDNDLMLPKTSFCQIWDLENSWWCTHIQRKKPKLNNSYLSNSVEQILK